MISVRRVKNLVYDEEGIKRERDRRELLHPSDRVKKHALDNDRGNCSKTDTRSNEYR